MHTITKLALVSLPLLTTAALADDNRAVFPPSNALSNPQSAMNQPRVMPNTASPMTVPQLYPQAPAMAQRQQVYANPYAQQPYNTAYPVQQPYNNGAYPMQPPMFNGMPSPMNYQSPPWQLSQMSPMGNTFSPTAPFANASMVPSSPWGNSSSWFNPWKSWNTQGIPYYPAYQYQAPNKKKSWGDVRNIWPDFYTDFTEDIWDGTINAPYDMGRMPGGWRAPSFSSPDPVTVGDAVTNQFPPMMEEAGNMINFAN